MLLFRGTVVVAAYHRVCRLLGALLLALRGRLDYIILVENVVQSGLACSYRTAGGTSSSNWSNRVWAISNILLSVTFLQLIVSNFISW